jgi:hypothetical protein
MLVASCTSGSEGLLTATKLSAEDPFSTTMVGSEFFDVDATENKVVQAEGGTRIVLPKGCFLNADGEPYMGKVRIELAEALTYADMINSNLTTTSSGEPLESGGMLFFTATGEGEALKINPELPVYIEVPTHHRKPGMQVYEGVRDSDGNMEWMNPRPLENFLVQVDLDLLDFKPEGFEQLLNEQMPINGHHEAHGALADSFYYALQEYLGVDGYGTDSSLQACNCGISPAAVKALKDPAMQNSFIATREFEWRMRALHKTCKQAALELYTSNLSSNLKIVDTQVAALLKGTSQEETFADFAALGHTNVKNGREYRQLLSALYNENLAYCQAEIRRIHEEARAAKAKQIADLEAEMQKLQKEYADLVKRRDDFAYETYGFTLTKDGWVNIDRGTREKDWTSQQLEILVSGTEGLDRTHIYLLFPSNGTLVKVDNIGEGRFGATQKGQAIKMPKGVTALAIAIGYKGDAPSLGVREFKTGTEVKLGITLSPSTPEELNQWLEKHDALIQVNSVALDLDFMQQMNKVQIEEYKLLLILHDDNTRMYTLAHSIMAKCPDSCCHLGTEH